ncbi:metallophosphoesterase [Lutispora thermophila]|uniref:Predicted phosphohydrolase, MPP superfamily n=1 Tax=Lutispora thermophila DSM 19022 TaxID=1122184 RepID=A0A1M6B7K1_9FIRM|nr:metallophosphoesterase [Lutispora thermophila]SHI44702.1 Predicted phosphohydrolase, MPP superfamily [Lutispora thermophila DSM 19022]
MLFLNGKLSNIINKYELDYLIITGDLSNNIFQHKKIVEEIKKIKVNCKILIALGNSERSESRFLHRKRIDNRQDLVREDTNREKIRVLINESEIYNKDNLKILFYGFDNSIYGNEKHDFGLEASEFDYRILFAHSPNIIKFIEKNHIKYDLLLAGHTHINQINIPIVNKLKNKYWYYHIGLKVTSKKVFCISRGLGTSRLPLRINYFPGITIFNFN